MMTFEELAQAKSLPDQPLYQPKEAAALLGVTQTTISAWCREGRLDGLKAGKHWKYFDQAPFAKLRFIALFKGMPGRLLAHCGGTAHWGGAL